jgi:hypothetical protein
VMSAPLTNAPESSSWPTMKASSAGKAGEANDFGSKRDPSLPAAAIQFGRDHLWPTTRGSDGSKGGPNQRGSGTSLADHHRNELREQPGWAAAGRVGPIRKSLEGTAADWGRENLWPTATDAKASGAAGYSTESGRHAGTTLTDSAVRFPEWGAHLLWPTASARDWKSGDASQETLERNSRPLNEIATAWARSHLGALTLPGGPECLRYDPTLHRLCLNAAFVEWLMGWPEGWTLPSVRIGCAAPETASSSSRPPMPGAASGATSLGRAE